jgi:hypothetical protein
MKYPVGTKLEADGVKGVVVENTKLPGDICVVWEHLPQVISYDEDFLDEFCKVVHTKETK